MMSQEVRDRGKVKILEIGWTTEEEEFEEANFKVESRIENGG